MNFAPNGGLGINDNTCTLHDNKVTTMLTVIEHRDKCLSSHNKGGRVGEASPPQKKEEKGGKEREGWWGRGACILFVLWCLRALDKATY